MPGHLEDGKKATLGRQTGDQGRDTGEELRPAPGTQTQTREALRFFPLRAAAAMVAKGCLAFGRPFATSCPVICPAALSLKCPYKVNIYPRAKGDFEVLDVSLALSSRPTEPEKPVCCCMLHRL